MDALKPYATRPISPNLHQRRALVPAWSGRARCLIAPSDGGTMDIGFRVGTPRHPRVIGNSSRGSTGRRALPPVAPNPHWQTCQLDALSYLMHCLRTPVLAVHRVCQTSQLANLPVDGTSAGVALSCWSARSSRTSSGVPGGHSGGRAEGQVMSIFPDTP